MAPALGLLTILIFAVAFWRFGVLRAAAGALAVMRQVASVMRDPQSDDLAREAAARRGAFQLLTGFCSVAARSGLACIASIPPLWVADAAGVVSQDAVISYISRWEVLAVASAALTAAYVAGARLCRPKHPTRL